MPENESYQPMTSVPQTFEQPKQNNFLTIFMSVLLVISVSISGFFAYQTQKLTKELTEIRTQESNVIPSTEPTIEPTASTLNQTMDWKTYTNKALGFELKYPPTFAIDKELNDQFNRATTFKDKNSTFEVMLKTSNGSLDKYYYMDNPNFSKSTIGGKISNVYTYDASKGGCINDGMGPACPISYVVYVSQNGSDFYHFSFFGDDKLSDIEKQILSTFKFLD